MLSIIVCPSTISFSPPHIASPPVCPIIPAHTTHSMTAHPVSIFPRQGPSPSQLGSGPANRTNDCRSLVLYRAGRYLIPNLESPQGLLYWPLDSWTVGSVATAGSLSRLGGRKSQGHPPHWSRSTSPDRALKERGLRLIHLSGPRGVHGENMPGECGIYPLIHSFL